MAGMSEAEATYNTLLRDLQLELQTRFSPFPHRIPQMRISFTGAFVTSGRPKDSRDHAYIENLSAALLDAHLRSKFSRFLRGQASY